jgi:outer membrane biosynthesis protein TonB
MKAIITSLLLLIGGATFAGSGENLLDRIMHRKISYPESLRSKGIEARVNVLIRVTDENSVEIVTIDSESAELKVAVEQQIKQLKFNLPKSMVGQIFQYVYKFEVQK